MDETLMEPGVRTFSLILQDIVRNLQEILRSEARLARKEVGEELGRVRHATVLLAVGAVGGLFALFFLLLAAFLGMALWIPAWAAALLIGALLAAAAGALIKHGAKRFRQIQLAPERTVETMKENLAWARQLGK